MLFYSALYLCLVRLLVKCFLTFLFIVATLPQHFVVRGKLWATICIESILAGSSSIDVDLMGSCRRTPECGGEAEGATDGCQGYESMAYHQERKVSILVGEVKEEEEDLFFQVLRCRDEEKIELRQGSPEIHHCLGRES